MANIDEAFAALSDVQSVSVNENVDFVVDSYLRVISIPVRGVVLGVEGDKDVNRVTFRMSRTYKGVDMSQFQIRINYANANNELNYFKVTEITVSDDEIVFVWVVGADAVAYVGNVEFVVRFIKLSGSNIIQELNTTLATAKSLIGLSVDGEISPVQREDLLAHFYNEIDAYSETKKNEILDSIPEDYTALANEVDELKSDLDDLINEDNNLFVKETIIGGVKFGSNNSAMQIDNENYCVTDFIECEPNTKYCISGACLSENNVFMVFYDADKTFIKSSVMYASDRALTNYIGRGFVSTGGVFQTESNTKYFRLSVRLCDVDTIRIYKSDRYKPPVERVKNTNFKKYGLIDKNNITNRCFLGASVGNLVANDEWYVTDYIPCFGEDYITIGYNAVNTNTGMAFYDENYTYISVISLKTGNVTTYQIPEGVHYLRFTIKAGIDAIVNFGRTLCAYNDRKDVINSENIKPIENMVLVPSDVYLAKGVQTDIYYNNLLMLADDSMQGMGYSISGLGIGYKRFFRPDISEVKNGIVNFAYADKFGNAYNQKSTNISVIEPELPPNLNVMCMGDSFTYNGKYMVTLKENLEAKGCTVEYIGTITNSAGYKCQGINGKSISMYTAMDTSNPLYNADTGTLDFSNFISSKNLNMPDVLIIQFAFNDTKDTKVSNYGTIINDIMTVVDLYHTANPSGKVIYSLENCSCELDRDRLTVLKKLSMMGLYEQIIKVFNIDDYPYMLVCPSYMFVDRINGYDLTNITFSRGTHTERVPKYDSTHPSNDVGQLQIGDALTGYVMALFN